MRATLDAEAVKAVDPPGHSGRRHARDPVGFVTVGERQLQRY
jgi:hypothetical protein